MVYIAHQNWAVGMVPVPPAHGRAGSTRRPPHLRGRSTLGGRMKKFLLFAVALMSSAFMFAGVASAADTTEVVTPADLAGGDWFTSDTRAPGTGTFENGPATPPEGTGS